MDGLLPFVIGVLVGIGASLIGFALLHARERESSRLRERREQQRQAPMIQEEMQTKRAHLQDVLQYFRSHDHVRNDDIEAYLGVSDSTARRYLDTLEHAGKIKQIGETGSGVYYVPLDLSPMAFEELER